MTPQSAIASESAADGPGAMAPNGFGGLVVFGLIAAVIVAECLFSIIYVSLVVGAIEEEAVSPTNSPAVLEPEPGEDDPLVIAFNQMAKREVGVREIDLGEFSVSAFEAASNSNLLIAFHLYGTLPIEDEPGCSEHLEAARNRIRDQVIAAIRSAELADLTDPALRSIKQRILVETNRILGRSLLQEVVFSDLIIVEQ
jgi:hypothetical protein